VPAFDPSLPLLTRESGGERYVFLSNVIKYYIQSKVNRIVDMVKILEKTAFSEKNKFSDCSEAVVARGEVGARMLPRLAQNRPLLAARPGRPAASRSSADQCRASKIESLRAHFLRSVHLG
jgi:hypothetical protein